MGSESPTLQGMLPVLRFVGLVNAAIWLGAGVFFTFAAGPAMFSQEMKDLLGPAHQPYSGLIAMILIKRYFVLHYVCAGVALVHLIVEALYTGRPMHAPHGALLGALLGLALLGGLWLQPKMRGLQSVKYGRQVSAAQRAAADVAFKRWHAVSQVSNLLMLGGVVAHLWRVARPGPQTRFTSVQKFRG